MKGRGEAWQSDDVIWTQNLSPFPERGCFLNLEILTTLYLSPDETKKEERDGMSDFVIWTSHLCPDFKYKQFI